MRPLLLLFPLSRTILGRSSIGVHRRWRSAWCQMCNQIRDEASTPLDLSRLPSAYGVHSLLPISNPDINRASPLPLQFSSFTSRQAVRCNMLPYALRSTLTNSATLLQVLGVHCKIVPSIGTMDYLVWYQVLWSMHMVQVLCILHTCTVDQ